MIKLSQRCTKMKGVALLEALIAIAIFSIALLGLLGMQAQAIKNNSQAKFRADASFIANQILADMSLDRSNLASYDATTYSATNNPTSPWATSIMAALPNGRAVVTVAVPLVTIVVFWQPNTEMTSATNAAYEHQFTLVASINAADV